MSANRRGPRGRRRAVAVVLGFLLAVGWFGWLRPTSLGGRQTYVVVQGSSMEPTYHDGDLVLVRKESDYEVGDIVAFRAGGSFDDPTRIIHRIVDQSEDGTYKTRGDNRDRIDPWNPGNSNVIGRAVLHVPHLGDLASAAGQPQVLAALGGATVILGRKRRRRRPTPPVPSQDTVVPSIPERPRSTDVRSMDRSVGAGPRWLRHTEPRWAFIGLVVAAALSLPVLAGLWSAVRASTSVIRTETLGSLDHSVSVDYRFVGDPSPVYPTGSVSTVASGTGLRVPTDPLYARLLRSLELTIDLAASAQGADEFTSSYEVDVTVAMPEGWSRTVASVGLTPFDAGASTTLVVNLPDVRAQVAEVAALTGVGGERYTIDVSPRLTVEASGQGATARDTLAPRVTFVVTEGVIEVEPLSNSAATAPLVRQVQHTTEYGFGPVEVETSTARGLLGGLAMVLIVAAAWCGAVLFGGVGLSEADRINARYRMQLVDVSSATGPPGPVVMVGGIGELARLARVEQSVILHEDLGDGAHRYRVFLAGVTYEYETAPASAAGAMPGDATVADEPLK